MPGDVNNRTCAQCADLRHHVSDQYYSCHWTGETFFDCPACSHFSEAETQARMAEMTEVEIVITGEMKAREAVAWKERIAKAEESIKLSRKLNKNLYLVWKHGFEEGKKYAAPEPGTSAVRWARYTGDAKTLPKEEKTVLLRLKEMTTVGDLLNGYWWIWDNHGQKSINVPIGIGDLWAYLPEPPEEEG